MTVTVAELRGIDLFDEVADADLEPWADAFEERRLERGDTLVTIGETDVPFSILLEGRMDGYVLVDGREERDHHHDAPTWMGAILALSGNEARVAIRASGPSRAAQIAADRFRDLLFATPPAFQKVIRVFGPVMARLEASQLQREKLAALGQMSAGLAHELNNPASAIVRSVHALGEQLDEGETAMRALCALGLTDSQMAAVETVRQACEAAPLQTWTPLERADREDRLEAWIEAHGGDAEVAAPLAETALSLDVLEGLAGVVPDAALEVTLRWIAGACAVRGLRQEIERGAARVFELVSAVKGFTQMDRTPVAEPVDVGRGLRDTITILRSKAASKSVSLSAEVDPNLPAVQGVAAELNQIWSNLVDNALDAVGPGGRVAVSARGEGGRVVVQVEDDGHGIPAEIRAHIFDPFFSTKDVGKGVGLGLDIARRTIERHDGEIEVESRPGRTVFRVSLPAEGMRSSGRWSRATPRIQIEE